MANVLHVLPDLDGDELGYVQLLVADMTEEEAMQFALMYRARRKDPQMILILTLVGFLGFAGIQRFVVGHIGLGVLYILTAGLCFVGIIVDLVNYRRIASDYNQKQAYEVALIMRRFTAPRAA
jgi:TM2 domain-containing membrane protein YozV